MLKALYSVMSINFFIDPKEMWTEVVGAPWENPGPHFRASLLLFQTGFSINL